MPQTGNKDRQAKAAKVVACLNSDDNQLSLAKDNQTIPTKTALLAKFSSEQPEHGRLRRPDPDRPGPHR